MPVMDVAAPFYASGTFWAGAGVLAAVLGTFAVVWVTLTVGFPAAGCITGCGRPRRC